MAATQLNVGGILLQRGKAFTQAFTATTQVVQFSVSQAHVPPNGLDCLNASVVGGTGTTGIAVECSLDGGTSWFSVGARPQASPFGTTTIGGDPAVIAAVSYDISGLASATFRAGVTGITAGTANLTLYLS